jgi:hypothetical protein
MAHAPEPAQAGAILTQWGWDGIGKPKGLQ